MIEGLKPYPAYRPTGLAGLESVPAGWDAERAKVYFREVDERSTTGAEELLSVSHKTGVTPRREKTVSMFMAESHVGYKLCRPGDIAVNTMWAWMSALGVSRHLGIVSPSYGVYRPRGASSFLQPYLDELLRTPAYTAEYNVRSTGITSSRLRLYPDVFLRIPLVCPPLDEQTAIVRFLGHADRRIRKYIRAKQQLIKLLEEQRQAIIHRAVTRGLDPNVRLKPSGVDWLGDVPEHWDVVALRYRYSQCLGKMLDSKRITGAKLVPYLRNTDVQWDRINTVELPTMDIDPDEYERYTVQMGDLLICEGGEVGRCAIWNGGLEICGFQKALHRLRPRRPERDSPRYMFYQLQAATRLGAFDDGHRSTIAHLTGDKLRAHRFVFPPATEQAQILEMLDERCMQSNSIADRARFEIHLLREYRTRLFSDVLTGQLDVRAAAAALPDDLPETEPLDEADAGDEDSLDADEAPADEEAPR